MGCLHPPTPAASLGDRCACALTSCVTFLATQLKWTGQRPGQGAQLRKDRARLPSPLQATDKSQGSKILHRHGCSGSRWGRGGVGAGQGQGEACRAYLDPPRHLGFWRTGGSGGVSGAGRGVPGGECQVCETWGPAWGPSWPGKEAAVCPSPLLRPRSVGLQSLKHTPGLTLKNEGVIQESPGAVPHECSVLGDGVSSARLNERSLRFTGEEDSASEHPGLFQTRAPRGHGG